MRTVSNIPVPRSTLTSRTAKTTREVVSTCRSAFCLCCHARTSRDRISAGAATGSTDWSSESLVAGWRDQKQHKIRSFLTWLANATAAVRNERNAGDPDDDVLLRVRAYRYCHGCIDQTTMFAKQGGRSVTETHRGVQCGTQAALTTINSKRTEPPAAP